MKILLCPLDWGLGHATRCIPLVRALLANGHEIRIGASGGGRRLLQEEFPQLEIFDFPGYRVRYSRSSALFLIVMILQMPRVLLGILAEAKQLKRMLAAWPCDMVISDGRYGVFSSKIPCIFITHQIFLRIPGRFPGKKILERILLSLNVRMLKRFTKVWVPDRADSATGSGTLSGALSHGESGLENLEFINPLSRFTGMEPDDIYASPSVDILALVSGPEPQRSLFEEALRRELALMPGTRVLLRGQPSLESQPSLNPLGALGEGKLTEYAHLPGFELAKLIKHASMIISRSGYTTIMELAELQVRKVVLVPTPGQSEQEYLADHLQISGSVIKMDQARLDLKQAMVSVKNCSGFAPPEPKSNSVTTEKFSLTTFIANHSLFQGTGSKSASISNRKPSKLS